MAKMTSILQGDTLVYQQRVRPGITSWKAEGIAICQFVHLLHMLEEVADFFFARYVL